MKSDNVISNPVTRFSRMADQVEIAFIEVLTLKNAFYITRHMHMLQFCVWRFLFNRACLFQRDGIKLQVAVISIQTMILI